MPDYKCQLDVYRGASRISGIGIYSHCGKPATIQLPNGAWVCYYHSPKRIAKREAAKQLRRELKTLNRRRGIGKKQRTL